MALFNKLSIALIIPLVAFSFFNRSLAQNSPQDYHDVHNLARAQVGVQNITWNDTVAAYAQEYALSNVDCAFGHSFGSPYGENIARAKFEEMTGALAVQWFVDEKPFYDYESNKCIGGECLHYTQVVWRNSTQLGCPRVGCDNGFWFVTCNYYPRGNIGGDRPY